MIFGNGSGGSGVTSCISGTQMFPYLDTSWVCVGR